MIAEDLNSKLDFIASNGVILNVEEKSALQTSLLVLKKNCKFKRTQFWGKIIGLQKDYLIAQGYGNNLFGTKKTFTSHDGVEWVQLPELSAEVAAACDLVKGRFTGDPSTELVVEIAADDNRSLKTLSVTEEKRLSRLVQLIDQDTAVVPIGSFIQTAKHHVIVNGTFEGLNISESEKLHKYCHFHEPEKLLKKTLLQREGLSDSLDFMDTIDEDLPKGAWAIRKDSVTNVVNIRSLLWPGFFAFHVAGTPNFGYCYFGNGEKNSDIGFML